MNLLNKIKKAVEKLEENNDVPGRKDAIFYRGQGAKHKLVPSLLRTCPKDQVERMENILFCDTFVTCQEHVKSLGSWEILAMMQHFGIPTRLLDWTSSFGNALYFAIKDCLCDCNNKCKKCNSKPTIWLLNPYKMHMCFYKELEHRLSITIGVDDVADYKDIFLGNEIKTSLLSLPKKQKKWTWTNPIFLEVPWSNLRIKSQKGYFTIHRNDTPLETLKGSETFLSRIDLSPKDIQDARDLIKLLDITIFDMFSDLSSLSQHLRSYIPEKENPSILK